MRRLYWAMILLFVIASVTNGGVQEACATVAYLGIGVAAIFEIAARRRRAHEGE